MTRMEDLPKALAYAVAVVWVVYVLLWVYVYLPVVEYRADS